MKLFLIQCFFCGNHMNLLLYLRIVTGCLLLPSKALGRFELQEGSAPRSDGQNPQLPTVPILEWGLCSDGANSPGPTAAAWCVQEGDRGLFEDRFSISNCHFFHHFSDCLLERHSDILKCCTVRLAGVDAACFPD